MKIFFKILNIVGYFWIVLAGIYILIQYLSVLTNSGIPLTERILSFINLWNILFAIALIVPGLVCIILAEKYSKNELRKPKP